ncbi:MAG: type II secretion system protein [Caulobacteraceae bacterium]
MLRRINNKKGFTIIEIMVVIALIGILAAVLVPKFGAVKDRAKDTGVLTNAKMAEAYVASIINDWTADNAVGATAGTGDMIEAINTYFGEKDNQLTNPYTGATAGAIVVESGSAYKTGGDPGVIYVEINADKANDTLSVLINGFNGKSDEIKSTERTVTR